LFWKRKKASDIELPGDEEEHRTAFRIRPVSDKPIVLKVAGNSFYLVNVSGTGCCFRSTRFKEGNSAAGTLTIPSEDTVFPVSIHVVSRQRDLCRCEFSKISQPAQEMIHAYVLEVQKKQIRNR